MKIIIHSFEELLKLSELVLFGNAPREVRIDNKVEIDAADVELAELAKIRQALWDGKAEPQGLPDDLEPPVVKAPYVESAVTDELPGCDSDGVAHNTDWHSEPAKINADGRWRARRKRDEDAYKAWLLEQAVEVAEAAIAADEAEPVATETHALPQDDVQVEPETAGDPPEVQVEPETAGPTDGVDLEALIAASLEAAQDASDSHVDLLNACRDFTSKHGHPAFTALKAAVAPDDAGSGKAVQHFTPGERRLMQACIANYPTA